MAIIIGDAAPTRYEIAGEGAALLMRRFTPEERAAWDHDWIVHANRPDPKGTSKVEIAARQVARRRALLKKAAMTLLIGWDGFVDSKGQDLPFDDTSKAAFFADPEMRKYWEPAITQYLWPSVNLAEKDEDPLEEVPFRPGT